jgi:hypothetical protein
LKDSVLKDNVRGWLIGLSRDPLAKMLIENSHLTKTQLETFVIDVLAEKIAGKSMVYDTKAKLRLIHSGVSRGAFNRTLAQARKNIIKSIYTVILLGYLGIHDTSSLEPYLEIANKISTYTEAYRKTWQTKRTDEEYLRVIRMLQTEIEKGLQQLSKPKSMSKNRDV